MTTTTTPHGPLAALRQFFGVPFRAQTYRNLGYLALAFPLGLTYFVVVLTGLSTGAGLAITLVGIPLLVVTVAGAVAIAGFEAKLTAWLTGMEASQPEAVRDITADDLDSLDGWLETTKRLLTAPTTWTSLVLVLLKFVFGVVAFTAIVSAAAIAGAFLSMPLFYDAGGVTYTIGPYVVDTFAEALAGGGLGVLAVLVSLHLLNALAKLHGFTTVALLGDAPEPTPDGA